MIKAIRNMLLLMALVTMNSIVCYNEGLKHQKQVDGIQVSSEDFNILAHKYKTCQDNLLLQRNQYEFRLKGESNGNKD